MKKLMILVAAASLAGLVNAATCNWSGSAVALKSATDDPTKYTVYLLDATVTDASTMAGYLTNGDTSYLAAATVTTTAGIAVGSPATAARWGKNGFGSYTAGDAYTYYTVIFNDAVDSADYFMITAEKAATVPSSGSLAMSFGSQASNSWVAMGSSPVPEPTSGLLMLLGMAGLALRRRRA